MFANELPMRRLEGAAMLVLGIAFYARAEYSWLMFALLFFAPDLGMAGYWVNRKVGAAAYNLTHWLVWPLTLGTAGIWTGNDTMISVALIWGAHVGFDRMLGWGLKTPESFCHTDMGLKQVSPKAPAQLQP